jgi:hypothetical protein
VHVVNVDNLRNGRNGNVFHNKQAPSHIVFDKVKKEARLWVGAKGLGGMIPEE